MGTGGKIHLGGTLSDERKYKMIARIVGDGSCCDEWYGAGVFNAISKIVNNQVMDDNELTIQKLMDEASNF